jgi:hypothetical protein
LDSFWDVPVQTKNEAALMKKIVSLLTIIDINLSEL